MSLRLQLLLVSLLVLVLPWAAYRYVQEMEGALRAGQQQALLATGRAVAQALADQPLFADLQVPAAGVFAPLYAGLLPHPVALDGYTDDWTNYPHDYRSVEFGSGVDSGTVLRYRAGIRDERLYLLLEIEDGDKIYYRPVESRANGDRVVLRLLAPNGGFEHFLIASSATGAFNAQHLTGRQLERIGAADYRIHGYWLELGAGYRLEIALPLAAAAQGLDFFFIDVDQGGTSTLRWQGTARWGAAARPTPLLHPSRELGAALKPFTPDGHRLRVTDDQGWLLAEQDRRDAASAAAGQGAEQGLWDALLIHFVRWSLGQETRPPPLHERSGQLAGGLLSAALGGRAGSDWFRPRRSDTPAIVAAAPIRRDGRTVGTVVVEQASDLVGALTDLAFTRLFYLTLLALFAVVLGLLGFASLLSWRVRRLRNAAEQAVAADGTIRDGFPRSRSRDELGDLSRSYADLLDELRDYTGYLRRLASILSHELRTPLAVVKSSLENLQQLREGETADAYLARAQEGTERLGGLLAAMSEAGRVEQAVRGGEDEALDLAALLESCVAGYRSAYPGHRFELRLDTPAGAGLRGQPDLLVQMLDKLIDNAAGFSPPDQPIRVALSRDQDELRLTVSNHGPALPEHLRNRLFDPMVTVREKRGTAPHLGLGLYIVRLIVERHRGRVGAHNLPGAAGVEVVVSLPAAG